MEKFNSDLSRTRGPNCPAARFRIVPTSRFVLRSPDSIIFIIGAEGIRVLSVALLADPGKPSKIDEHILVGVAWSDSKLRSA